MSSTLPADSHERLSAAVCALKPTAAEGSSFPDTARTSPPHSPPPHSTPPTHTHTHTHARSRARAHPPTHAHMRTHTHTHACTHPPTRTHARTHPPTHPPAHAHPHPRMYAPTHPHARTHADRHTHTHARIHTHTHTHTHTTSVTDLIGLDRETDICYKGCCFVVWAWLSPDITLCGWLGSKHKLINKLDVEQIFPYLGLI